MKSNTYRKIMDLVGSPCIDGEPGDPPEARTVYYVDGKETTKDDPEAYILTAGNDGYELWFGTAHKWYFHMRYEDVRILTKYLIWDWYIKSRWLGIRRPIYYWALHMYISSWKKGLQ